MTNKVPGTHAPSGPPALSSPRQAPSRHPASGAHDSAPVGWMLSRAKSRTSTLTLCCAVFLLTCALPAHGQSAPVNLYAYEGGPTLAVLKFSTNIEDQTLPSGFRVSRTPTNASFPQALEVTNVYDQQTFFDRSVSVPHVYTYKVCAIYPDTAEDKYCASATVTIAPVGSPGGSGSMPQPVPAQSGAVRPPPTQLRLMPLSGSSVSLTWQNPVRGTSIELVRSYWLQYWYFTVPDGTTRWSDHGLLPHTGYTWTVCEGTREQTANCSQVPGLTLGADPVIQAARTSPTSVRLKFFIDNPVGITRFVVTRESSNDPCRQPSMLNGKQVCLTGPYTPSGAPRVSNDVTVVDLKNGYNDFFVDTAAEGPSYYYVACATWGLDQSDAVKQCSGVATVEGLSGKEGQTRMSARSFQNSERQGIRMPRSAAPGFIPPSKQNETLSRRSAEAYSPRSSVLPPRPSGAPAEADPHRLSTGAQAAPDTALLEGAENRDDPDALFKVGLWHYEGGHTVIGSSEMRVALALAQNQHNTAVAASIERRLNTLERSSEQIKVVTPSR